MRIVYMLTSLGIGGAERQVIALAERMAARGHAVTFLVLREPQPEQWPTHLNVTHLGMRKTPGAVVAGFAQARRVLRAFRPDLVHSHTYPANLCARTLRLIGAAPTILSTIHNVYEGGSLRMLLYRITDPLSLRTTAVSTAAAERFVRNKAVPQRKCTVLTNGIDVREFYPDAARSKRLRAELSAGGDFIWLAAGRITQAKDYPNLLQAFPRVHAEIPRSQLWIAGEGDSALLHELQNEVASAHLISAIRFLGLRRDMPALLDAADGFVLSSAWEGMPLVLGEAMAMKKPIVATDVGGVRELAGDTGVLVPARAPEALADAMLAVMQSSPAARHAQGSAARSRIESSFSIDAKADEWEALYRSLLERSGAPESSLVAW